MSRETRWKMPLIVICVAMALLALYPPKDRIIRKEWVKEQEGAVVGRKTLAESWLGKLVRSPAMRETVVKEEVDADGKKVREKTIEYIAKGRIKLGLDLKGGSELLYKVRVEPGQDKPGITHEIIDVLKKRIDPKGIMEYRIQEQGPYRVLIQVPGATKAEVEALKDRIVRLGKLEFRLAAPRNSQEHAEAARGKQVPGYYRHWVGKKRGEVGETEDWYLVRNRIELTGESLSRVFPDRKDIHPVVGFEFNTEGKAKFAQLTERNIGKPMAIILDGTLYSAPVIRERIPGRGIIEGNFTQEEVNNLIAIMRAGSLPADLEMEMETSVGPSLGKDSIKKGLLAGVVGSVFVVLFMVIYYLGCGIVANIALVMNILLVMGVLALLGATLTLPGIAGLVLMVGMAVDANVLIFERIREEKLKGKAIPLAVKTGYERAFTTIIDSNLTTLITALILYAVGTGPIKGFAITLSSGLVINIFTAVFVTRVIFDVLPVREYKMLQLFHKTEFSFMRFFRYTVIGSTVCILMGLAMFKFRGVEKYDIDFTGGTLIHLQLANPTPAGKVRATLAETGYHDAEVQGIWTATAMMKAGGETNEFGIRIKGLADDKVKQKVTTDLKKVLEKEGQWSGIEFGKKVTGFNLKLSKVVDEPAMQKYLSEAGYSEEDVLALVPLGQRTRDFELTVPSLKDPKTRVEAVNKLLAALPGMEYHHVDLSFGEIREMEPQAGVAPGRAVAAQYSMDIDASEPIDPELLELELRKAHFSDVSVMRRAAETRRLASTKLQVIGHQGDLTSIKQGFEVHRKFPAITFTGDVTLQIRLVDPADESAVKTALGPTVTCIVSLNAASQSFAVEMNPLHAGKLQEKVQEDIFTAFKDNLYRESINVGFEEVKESPSAGVAEAAPAGTLVQLSLSKPLPAERIEEVLSAAGYRGAVADVLEIGKNYQGVRLRLKAEELEDMKSKVTQAFAVPNPLKRVVSIGSTVAGEMKNRAILAIIFSMIAIVIYIWFRFGELRFGVAAVLALMHDVCFTMGAVAVADQFSGIFGDVKLNLAMVASFLTLIGYSLNDTIVVFDRIRENMAGRKFVDRAMVDLSVNQTISRTVLTSSTVFTVVVALYLLGGTEIHGFAYVMMVGVLVGTYSSIFIASPILVEWDLVKKFFGLIFYIITAPLWLPIKGLRKVWGGGSALPRSAS